LDIVTAQKPFQPAAYPASSQSVRAMPPISAATLFAGGKEVVIAHGADLYRLRLTRQNKLILTK